jgi:hypothetical protein
MPRGIVRAILLEPRAVLGYKNELEPLRVKTEVGLRLLVWAEWFVSFEEHTKAHYLELGIPTDGTRIKVKHG